MAMAMEGDLNSNSPNLRTFLETSRNVEQFEKFLLKKGFKDDLEFVCAVQGMKADEECVHVDRIIWTLHKHYFERIHVSPNVKLTVQNRISNKELSSDIFDTAVEQVWEFLESVVYKQFLNHLRITATSYRSQNQNQPQPQIQNTVSSVSVRNPFEDDETDYGYGPEPTTAMLHLQQQPPPVQYQCQYYDYNNHHEPSAASFASLSGSGPGPGPGSGYDYGFSTFQQQNRPQSAQLPITLPTGLTGIAPVSSGFDLEPLIEGQELFQGQRSIDEAVAIVGLTKKALKATQLFRSQTEPDLNLIPITVNKLMNQVQVGPYHSQNYKSYNPVSRQDSETQSMSSGCLTDSDSINKVKTKSRNQPKGSSSSKKDVNGSDSLPNLKPMQLQCVEILAETNTQDFATELIKRLNEWLCHPDPLITVNKRRKLTKEPSAISESLAQIFNNRCGFDDDSPPDNILDKHVKRVWSDDTPPHASKSRSPTGRREYKKSKASIRSRIHSNEPCMKNQLPKSRSFPSTSELSQDSGISIATTSTATSSTSAAGAHDYSTAKINYGIL